MARIPLVCPLDGTNLGAANANVNAAVVGIASATDAHTHVEIALPVQLSCQNGHTWAIQPFVLTLMRAN